KCAQLWPPLVAAARAAETIDWTIVARPDGFNQWAFRGKPLYLSSADEAPGDTRGAEDSEDWTVAIYHVTDTAFAAPGGVTVERNDKAHGDILVNYDGLTLYTIARDEGAACSDSCLDTWVPMEAGLLSKALGSWEIVEREDGLRQWAYDGRPLYTFSGDERAGDVHGIHFDSRWQPAALNRFFMPEGVQMRKMNRLVFFTTTDGIALYARDRYRYAPGSFHADDGSLSTVAVGRAIGTDACGGPCPEEWLPFTATEDEQASGYWSILEREDGTRQWAYQGYALYLNARDEKPGDMYGRDDFEFVDGSSALYWRLAIP
ncbi:MAG: hypothetical protein RLN70_12405, partial [Rhodospirillaceae bacterium]